MRTVTEHRELLLQGVDRVITAVQAYPDDADLWRSGGQWPNSGGTLALHLAGNLRHFIGAELGGDGYVRDREREFGARDLSRPDVAAEVQEARAVVDRVLGAMEDARLDAPWPHPRPVGEGRSVGYLLGFLQIHLAYHLGQLDYHRRSTDPS